MGGGPVDHRWADCGECEVEFVLGDVVPGCFFGEGFGCAVGYYAVGSVF